MASPTIDAGNGVGNSLGFSNSSASSGSVSSIWGTASTGAGVAVAVFDYEETSGTPSITAVTGLGGTLNFSLRSKVVNTTTGAHRNTIEVWTAPLTAGYNHAGANLALSWTFSSAYDDMCGLLFVILGTFSTSNPFDSGAVPQTAFNSTSTTCPAVVFSTTQNDDLLMYISGRAGGSSGTSAPSGWTLLASKGNGGGSNFAEINVYTKSVSAAQSSVSVADAQATNDVSWTSYVDAFTADNNNTTVNCNVTMTLFGPTIAATVNDYTLGGPASVTMTLFNLVEVAHAGVGPVAQVSMTLGGPPTEAVEVVVPAAPGTGAHSVSLTNG